MKSMRFSFLVFPLVHKLLFFFINQNMLLEHEVFLYQSMSFFYQSTSFFYQSMVSFFFRTQVFEIYRKFFFFMSSKSKKRKTVQKKPKRQGSVETNEASLETPTATDLTSSHEIDTQSSSSEICISLVSKDIPGQSLEDKEEQSPTFTEPEYNVKWPNQPQSYNDLSDSSVEDCNELQQSKTSVWSNQKKSSVYSPLSEENNYHDDQLQQLEVKTKCRSKRNDIAASIRHTLFSVFNEENLDRIDSNISPIKLAEWKSSLKTKAAYEKLFKDQQILLKIGYTVFKQYENKELPPLHCAFILSICDILLNPKSLSIKCNDKSVMRRVDAFLRAFESKNPITPQIMLEIAEAKANELEIKLKNQKSNNENESFSSSV
ncbi:hypothetical protein C2G38_2277035 [Gigaspora rosea]|uniref:Uncharacterized protein n=1 Tax=Gigaspora rosea TaxID=44941 RepID=A0A397U8I4_9GLOM|nr:hypothetical protein C2G38_2277035 [Gigaspora rosea]